MSSSRWNLHVVVLEDMLIEVTILVKRTVVFGCLNDRSLIALRTIDRLVHDSAVRGVSMLTIPQVHAGSGLSHGSRASLKFSTDLVLAPTVLARAPGT
jgi:hypothetical protein